MEPNLQEIHDVLFSLAMRAGEMILAAKPTSSNPGIKKNTTDPVTETDQAVEKMVYETLRSKYPDYDFMGEETYTKGQKISEKPVFIVDPIDGTTNFIHGYPFVCISLGFCVDARPTVGIVYNPFTSKLYSAIRGKGAFVRDVKNDSIAQLPLSSPLPKLDGLKDALVAIEWGSDRAGTNWESRVKLFSRLGSRDRGMAHGFRSTGSAAMNMCSVAAGESDAFWEAGAWAWDVAAGWAILEEAGGRVVDAYPMVIAKDWESRKPDVEGRMYFGVRKASEEEQLKVVQEYWNCVGDDLKFVYE